jgi:hypothetical protein
LGNNGRKGNLKDQREKKMKYAGADWLTKSYPNLKPSPLGLKVADILGLVWNGLYHMDTKKVKWENPYCIEVNIFEPLSTFDWNALTELVILCHDQMIRFTVQPCNMRYIKLLFHQRQREGSFCERHPTIEDAIEKCRFRWNEA